MVDHSIILPTGQPASVAAGGSKSNQVGVRRRERGMMTDKQFDSYKRLLLQQLQYIYAEQQSNKESADEKFKQFIAALESELKTP